MNLLSLNKVEVEVGDDVVDEITKVTRLVTAEVFRKIVMRANAFEDVCREMAATQVVREKRSVRIRLKDEAIATIRELDLFDVWLEDAE